MWTAFIKLKGLSVGREEEGQSEHASVFWDSASVVSLASVREAPERASVGIASVFWDSAGTVSLASVREGPEWRGYKWVSRESRTCRTSSLRQ